jgi:hypothetical protein
LSLSIVVEEIDIGETSLVGETLNRIRGRPAAGRVGRLLRPALASCLHEISETL